MQEFGPHLGRPTVDALKGSKHANMKELRFDCDLAASLGVGQDTISRIERRSDMLLSTLRRYIEAAGGQVDLVARFPNRPPLVIEPIAEEPVAEARRRASVSKVRRGAKRRATAA